MLLYIIRNILGDKYMKKEVGFENRDRFVELGLMISALRKVKGYTQYELAEKAHISRSHLSSIEAPNITSSFSLEVFFNIADILEVKPGDLLNLNLPSSYFNNDEKTLQSIIDLAFKLNITNINLLPYHTLGKNKWEQINKQYYLENEKMIEKKTLKKYIQYGSNKGINIKIGG